MEYWIAKDLKFGYPSWNISRQLEGQETFVALFTSPIETTPSFHIPSDQYLF
jgi:hypothetical protein